MIKVKKQFIGKNVMLRGKGKFTLGEEVNYQTAFMLADYGLGHYLIKEKKEKKEPVKEPIKYKAIDEKKEDEA